MLFVQCNKKNNTTEKSAKTPAAQTTSISGKLPIAYVNIDSLLQKYNYAKDLNESLLRRAENSRANVNEKGRQLEKEMAEFQRKYQNNAFLSQERLQQEQQRLMKKQQELQEYIQRLEDENMREQQKMLSQMNDSIINFIHEYNKDKKYEAILNNASTLYIDPSYDITNEIVDLLNKRYVKK
ncbi:hypothetical protein NSB1T_11445 [Coprobacter fastidiosus NSB1 = JCM 33896]|nr:hypothetical protein NSB1T_11445 [Coprobacter fastidiosus NSB1 = JCM 33896]BEG62382.1 OmpH family outer membrane protein [Coprobacter fastidiosus]